MALAARSSPVMRRIPLASPPRGGSAKPVHESCSPSAVKAPSTTVALLFEGQRDRSRDRPKEDRPSEDRPLEDGTGWRSGLGTGLGPGLGPGFRPGIRITEDHRQR